RERYRSPWTVPQRRLLLVLIAKHIRAPTAATTMTIQGTSGSATTDSGELRIRLPAVVVALKLRRTMNHAQRGSQNRAGSGSSQCTSMPFGAKSTRLLAWICTGTTHERATLSRIPDAPVV